MRKILITLTVFALIISIVGTGVIVFIETTSSPSNSTVTLSGE